VEYVGDGLIPAKVRVGCSYNPLSEDEVDDEEDEDTSRHKDAGSDANLDVMWKAGPNDSHDHGDDTSHAETEHESAHEEFVSLAFVDLKYCHVTGGGEDEEEEEDR
jgi:hypothetical protein